MLARVICLNDSIRGVVLNTLDVAEQKMKELADFDYQS